MSDEQTLRTALDRAADGAPGASRLDVAAAVRASRARRLPARLLVGAAATVLVIGGGGLALSALPGVGGVTTAANESADAPTAGDTDSGPEGGGAEEGGGIDPGALPACGESPSAEAGAGLELVVRASAEPGPDGVPVRITLRSTADAALELRLLAAPTAALTSDGRVIGAAGSDGTGAMSLTLEPGAERTWTALVPRLSCSTGDPLDPSADDAAELLAAVAVERLDAGGEVIAVTSETTPIAAR